MTPILDAQQTDAASELLFACWRGGRRIATLPDDVRPRTRAEGYAIQAQLHRRSVAALFGWKIAATSVAGQAHIAVDGPMAGRLFADRVIADGGVCPFGANHMRVAEMEFAFRFGRTLEPHTLAYTVDEVLAAVASLHPAIEIPDSRYDEYDKVGEAQIIADNACAHYFVLGPAAPDAWRDIDLVKHDVTGRVRGKLERNGSGANVLGDPRVALAWLVNELSHLGLPVQAGEVVTTGTCVTPMAIAAGDHVSGDFGVLGKVSVSISD